MPLPPSVTKINKKDGVTFTSSVDRTQYTIEQLINGALRDIGKVVRMRMIYKLRDLKGFKQVKKGDRVLQSTRYHTDYKTNTLYVGFTHNTWYGVQQELGTEKQPARRILWNTVKESIPDIMEIQGQYLSAINDQNKAEKMALEAEAAEKGQKEDQDSQTI